MTYEPLETEYFIWNEVPFEKTGTFINGDVKGIVVGTLAEYFELRTHSILVIGRFLTEEIVFVTKDNAFNALEKLLRNLRNS